MAKKREEKKKGSARQDRDCNLDGDYTSPLKSCHDLSAAAIKETLTRSRYAQLLLSLTVIGALLRFWNLGFNALWLDEASTYTFATMSIPGIWEATVGGEFNPPLFYWVEHVMLLFGNNEIVLRFVPALLGVLTIPLFYLIGKEYVDRNVGIIAAAACTFSPFLIIYSQEARAYSMMLFFVALATLFQLRASKTNTMQDWVLFGAFSALAFWSHFYAIVLIGALVLYTLYEFFPKIRADTSLIKPLAAGGAAFVILILPLVPVILQLFSKRTAGGPTFGYQGIMLIVETIKQVLTSPFSLPGTDLVFLVLVILFIIGVVQAFSINRNKGVFLLSLLVLTFLISYILSFKIPMMPRYLIFLSIILWIGVALSYKVALPHIPGHLVVYGFILLLLVFSLPFLSVYYTNYTKEDWRGVSADLSQVTKQGDYVVVMPGYVLQPLNYYYSNSTDGTIEYGASSAQRLRALSSQNTENRTVYYVVTADILSADPTGGALAWLDEHAQPILQGSNLAIFTSG